MHWWKDLLVMLGSGLGALVAVSLAPYSIIDAVPYLVCALFGSTFLAAYGPFSGNTDLLGKRHRKGREPGPWWPQFLGDLGIVWVFGGVGGVLLGLLVLALESSAGVSMQGDSAGWILGVSVAVAVLGGLLQVGLRAVDVSGPG